MEYYYKLNLDDYCGNENDITNIMLKFDEKLHEETGLSLEYYSELSVEKINNYYKEKDSDVCLEEICWGKMPLDQQAKKVVSYINKIKGIGKNLIIIDRYFFPKIFDNDYPDLIVKIFKDSQSKNIKIITQKNFNQNLYNVIINKLNNSIKIDIQFYKDIHDRFWIANNKAFVMGTSLNGLGRKIHCIKLLDYNENNDLLSYLKNNNLI